MKRKIYRITDLHIKSEKFWYQVYPCSHSSRIRMDRRAEVFPLRSRRDCSVCSQQPVHELLLCKGSAGVQKLQESGRCSGTRKPCMARSEQHIYFLLRTGSAYHEYRYSGVLGHLLPQSGTGGRFARYHHDARYTFVPRHHAGGLGTQPRERRIRFPLLSGAGRLVIKDIVILAGAVVLLSDSSQRVLKTLKKD